MTTFVESEGVVARLGRLERPTSGSGVLGATSQGVSWSETK